MATQAEIEAIVRSVVSQVLDDRPGASPPGAVGGASGRLGQFDTAEDAVAAAFLSHVRFLHSKSFESARARAVKTEKRKRTPSGRAGDESALNCAQRDA